jgi:hypothetical protein
MDIASKSLVVARRGGVAEWLRERRALLAWCAASRAAVLGAALALHWLRRPSGFFGPRIFADPVGVLGAWDGGWYTRVAAHGYLLIPGRQSDPAFFPLFPIVLRGAHSLGLSLTAAGVLISNVAFVVAVLALDDLGRRLLGPEAGSRSACYAAVFPAGFVFSMAYPESIVLAAMALAGSLALARRWRLAAVAAAVAALARPEGALVAIPLAATAWAQRRWLSSRSAGAAAGAVLAPLAAVASFPLYLHWALGDVTAWQRAEQAWGRAFKPDGPVRALVHLQNLALHPWLARDVALLVVYLVLLVLAYRRRVPRGWLVMGSLVLLLPLWSGSFVSETRFGLLALPVYWGLGTLRMRARLHHALAGAMLALLTVGTFTLPVAFP